MDPKLRKPRLHADLENATTNCAYLFENTDVRSFAWEDVSVRVKDRTTKGTKCLLDKISGVAYAGT